MGVRQSEAQAVVERYVRLINGETDSGFEELLAADFLDHVSGQRGGDIWAQVAAWSRGTFADPDVAVHEVMVRADRVMVWMTMTVTHVGSAFPRLRDVPVTHKRVPWDQVHFFRLVDGEILEHWAVRDDYAMVKALVGAGPLVAPDTDA